MRVGPVPALVFLLVEARQHGEHRIMGLCKRLIGCIMMSVDSNHKEAEVTIVRSGLIGEATQ